MKAREVILHLSLIEGIGSTTITSLIAHKPKDITWDMLYNFSVSDWHRIGASHKKAEILCAGLQDKSLRDQELELLDRASIQWASILDDAYPDQLRTIHAPPSILFWKGNLSCAKAISIVGSRDANAYGERCIRSIVSELVAHDFCIVSGGALGADAMAHEAALQAGGKTIVILGSGILHASPKTNLRLFETVLERGGAIVSSFKNSETAHAGNFPIRNRVISGLSQGVVVVQAAKKSGTRITAQYALDQGRDVFAFPGPIDDPLSAGCHALIQEGAKLIMGPEDILSEYGIFQSAHQEVQSSIRFDNRIERSYTDISNKDEVAEENMLHQKVLLLCVSAQSIDRLAQECGVSLSEMQNELFSLQMNGVVEQDFSGMWKLL